MKQQLSHSEENYLKQIFHIAGKEKHKVSTNALAEKMSTKASSITDMLKKLSEKGFVAYQKYKGCKLTEEGEIIAKNIIRKHRIWETFLVKKLDFKWDEVHDIAEQLEHIQSAELINRIDNFLGKPKFDPHGDPIPDKNGRITYRKTKVNLAKAAVKKPYEIVSVKEDSLPLLRYLDDNAIGLGTEIIILEKYDFDNSIRIEIGSNKAINLSEKVTQCIGVRPIEE